MLDTNSVSDLVRRPDGNVARRAIAPKPGTIAISIIVAAELRYGAKRLNSAHLTSQLNAVLSAIDTLPLDTPADSHYAVILTAVVGVGRTFGYNDLLVAAHARALRATLVTTNVGDFSRIPDLLLEDWQPSPPHPNPMRGPERTAHHPAHTATSIARRGAASSRPTPSRS